MQDLCIRIGSVLPFYCWRGQNITIITIIKTHHYNHYNFINHSTINMSDRKTFLVTGAGRGIGLGLAGTILQKPSATLIAAVRDPAKSTAAIEALPRADGARVIIVKIDSSVDADPAAAVHKLREEHGITSIDVVVANAGIAHSGTPVTTIDPAVLREHLEVNTVAPVLLLQAVLPLLKASTSKDGPLFLPLSTAVASNGLADYIMGLFPPTLASYGASKAALNFLVTRLHVEESWLTTFVVHPGLVLTDMGSGLVSASGKDAEAAAIDVPTSVAGLSKLIDEATRNTHGGSFKNYDGTSLPW